MKSRLPRMLLAATAVSSLGLAAGCGSSSTPTGTAVSAQEKTIGYVIDTGGSATAKPPGVTIIDRTTNSVKKTVRFTTGIASSGHFANVTADGSELWLCTNDPNGGVGTVNVIKTAVFDRYSTINSSNKNEFIVASYNVGCGIQSTQTPDGKYLFTSSNQGSQGINVFDVKNHLYLGNIANDNTAPHVGAVSPDGKVYYTTTAQKYHAVGYDITSLPSRVPTAADKVLDVDFGYGNLHALRLHPNGKYLFVGNATWPVSAGKTNTSGTNVIEIAAKKIVARVDSTPHNYAISPDAKYLASTDNSTGDCDYVGDEGALVQFVDISTLLSATPDLSKIRALYQFHRDNLGGSHAAWDPVTNLFYYSVGDTTGQGWLYVLNTANLAATPASVSVVVDKAKIGWSPHGVSFAGINGD